MRAVLVLAVVAGDASAVPDRPPAPPCHRAPAAVAAAVSAAVEARFVPEHAGGAASVDFACDRLGAAIREIVVETGSGHGGSLAIWRARRTAGDRFAVHGIVYRGSAIGYRRKDPPFELADGTIAAPDLELVRAALVARVSEIDPPGDHFDFRGSFSSGDFHAVVRLVDDDGRTIERRFTGYPSSDSQREWIPAAISLEATHDLTAIAPRARRAGDADRALFAERFVAAAPHFDDDFAWWVKERYVDLARYLGTADVLPGLFARLRIVRKPDRSYRDARTHALAAIAAIARDIAARR